MTASTYVQATYVSDPDTGEYKDANTGEHIDMYAKDCVARGAALMDERMPDWYKVIDLYDLDLSSITRCVLGQCYPESEPVPHWADAGYATLDEALADAYVPDDDAYNDTNPDRRKAFLTSKVCVANFDLGKYRLGLSDDDCAAYGFNTDYADNTFASLDSAWSIEVYDRQKDVA